MKRIAVGLVSLGMLAATSAQARYDYYGEGTTMRPDYRGYDHTRYMQSGQEGNYAPQSYWEQGRMRPVGHRGYDHERFEGGLEDRTSGRRRGSFVWEKRRYRRPFFSHQARYVNGGVRGHHDVRGSWDEGYVGEHGTWLGRGNARELPGSPQEME